MKKKLFEIKDAYKTLNPVQQAFVNEKYIDGTFSIKQWQQFLKGVARYDKINDERRGPVSTMWALISVAIILVLIGIILFIIFKPRMEDIFEVFIVGFFLTIWFGVLGGVGFKFWYQHRYAKTDIVNHLRKFILPLLLVLKEDAHAKTKVQLMLDFNRGDVEEKLIDTVNLNERDPYYKLRERIFHHQWAKGRIRLNDQTSIQWEGFDTIHELNVTKRRTSGKVKTKRKYKVRHLAEVSVGFQKQMYRLKNKQQNKANFIETADKYIFKLKVKQKYKSLNYPDGQENVIDIDLFLAAIMNAYKQVMPIS